MYATSKKIKNLEIKNRFVRSATFESLASESYVNDKLINFYKALAEGGVGLIITGILSVPSIMYLTKLLLSGEQKAPWLINCAIFAGTAALIGLLLIAFFDIKSQPIIHTISAMIFFFGAVYMIFFFSLSIFFNSKISWTQGLFSLIIAGVGLIFLLTLLALLMQGMDPVSIVVDTSPRSAEARFWEWMFIFAFFAWFLEIGIYTLRQE